MRALSSHEVRRLMQQLASGQRIVQEADCQAVFEWAQNIRIQHELLAHVLRGNVPVYVIDGDVKLGKEAGR